MNLLKDRVRQINFHDAKKGPVVYWMSRDQRVNENWALIYAAALASQLKSPVFVAFCLAPDFLGAGQRQYRFMLRGLKEVYHNLSEKGIPFFLLDGNPPDVLPVFLKEQQAGALIADFDPLKIKRAWKSGVCKKINMAFHEVDAHNIVPCWRGSDKKEYGAYTLRPKLDKLLPYYLEDYTSLITDQSIHNPVKWDKIIDENNMYSSVPEVKSIKPGESASKKKLSSFINNNLGKYHLKKNDPNKNAASGLSPYLHFGHISSQAVALRVLKSGAPEDAQKSFLEEVIIRKELADNFCFYEKDYDSVKGFPNWGRRTLSAHSGDSREYIYTYKEFENGSTHDPLWNAAQMEMIKTGTMHGYMRMYWAKKILEWSRSPEAAIKTAIRLNDRYQLDGRDPNGYTGIAWSIGGLHDRAWPERGIFGKIRFMNYEGCRRKFDVDEYIDRVNKIAPPV